MTTSATTACRRRPRALRLPAGRRGRLPPGACSGRGAAPSARSPLLAAAAGVAGAHAARLRGARPTPATPWSCSASAAASTGSRRSPRSRDPGYLAARPTIGVPASRALTARQPVRAAPGARAAPAAVTARARSAAVHAVGQLNPTRSHFAAMEDMEKAAPGSSLRTGWIDRMVGLARLAQPVRRHRDGRRRPRRARSSARAPRSRCASVDSVPALGARHRSRAGALGRRRIRGPVRRRARRPGGARPGHAGALLGTTAR